MTTLDAAGELHQHRTLRSYLASARAAVRRIATPYRVPLLAGGIVLTVVSSLLPWAKSGVTFTTDLAGNLSVVGLGGHRLYLLVLALFCLVGFTTVNGARRALLALSVGAVVICVYMFYELASGGGGLGAVAIGPWLGVVGSILLLVAADTTPESPRLVWPPLPTIAQLAVIVVAVGGLLALLVIGLDIQAESQFLSYSIAVGAAIAAASSLGANVALRTAFDNYRLFGYFVCLAAAIAFPFTQNGNATWMAVFARVGVFAAAAIGLNVVVGLAGLLDLGYIAFFGIGGYVAALLSDAVFTTVHVHVPFLLVIPLGAIAAGLIGVAFGAPTLRLRGDYLAIVTLGFGEIFRIVAINYSGLTRGPNGIAGIPDLRLPAWLGGFNFGSPHTVFGVLLPFQSNYYFLDIVLIAVVMLVFARLNDSRIGRGWIAIREDELAARAMGINTVGLKLLAFGIGATLAGGAGTINVHIGEAIEPNAYQFFASALLLSAVVLGGMGTVTGAVLGAALLIGLPEKLRSFQEWRLFIFGLALVLLMRFRPEGLIASRRRKLEFHDPEEGPAGALGTGLEEPE
jgi:branched-chain amino acid transport system permease protein